MTTIQNRERLHAVAHNSRREWFDIAAKADAGAEAPSEATVRIYAEIGDSWFADSVTAGDFARQVSALDVETIYLHLNSPGGDVYDGIAIANTIRQHKARVVVTVDGIAASAASFIAIAGDELVMARNSELMIHDAWGMALGNAEEMRALADRLDQVSNNIASMYAAKAGGDVADWRDVMRGEHWYSAEEAVDAGLADRVDGAAADAKAKNAFDLAIFAHAGRAGAQPPPMPGRPRLSLSLPSAHAGGQPSTTPTTPPQEGSAMPDTLTQGLRERLGIPADADLDEAGLLTALDQALAEQADPPQASAPAVPEGTVLVDQATLDELRASAEAGRQAHNRQMADDRAAIVNAAVTDGRISPARRDHWLASLEADPGSAAVLASLQPGTVPLVAKGFTGGVEEAPDDDRIYAAAWPSEGK